MKTNQYNEPDMIFLQLHDPENYRENEPANPKADGVTWCWEPMHHNDVEYIRKDLYDELKNQITAYQLTITNMEAAHDKLINKEPYVHLFEGNLFFDDQDWIDYFDGGEFDKSKAVPLFLGRSQES
jgi:hypothetical protein